MSNNFLSQYPSRLKHLNIGVCFSVHHASSVSWFKAPDGYWPVLEKAHFKNCLSTSKYFKETFKKQHLNCHQSIEIVPNENISVSGRRETASSHTEENSWQPKPSHGRAKAITHDVRCYYDAKSHKVSEVASISKAGHGQPSISAAPSNQEDAQCTLSLFAIKKSYDSRADDKPTFNKTSENLRAHLNPTVLPLLLQ